MRKKKSDEKAETRTDSERSGPKSDRPEQQVRRDVRRMTELDTTILGHDLSGDPWKEDTTLTNVSRSGAGFVLTRPCQVSHLLLLTMPMPADLRAFDHDKELYTVVGLVQYCHSILNEEAAEYSVGVAFVGQDLPVSYLSNPHQSYRITGVDEEGMWSVAETKTGFKSRGEPRFPAQLEATISLIKKHREADARREEAVTHDISAHGACVTCALDVDIGERVKFAIKEHNFYAIAVVRNRGKINDRQTLHLEFIDTVYPVKKIPQYFFDGDDAAAKEKESN